MIHFWDHSYFKRTWRIIFSYQCDFLLAKSDSQDINFSADVIYGFFLRTLEVLCNHLCICIFLTFFGCIYSEWGSPKAIPKFKKKLFTKLGGGDSWHSNLCSWVQKRLKSKSMWNCSLVKWPWHFSYNCCNIQSCEAPTSTGPLTLRGNLNHGSAINASYCPAQKYSTTFLATNTVALSPVWLIITRKRTGVNMVEGPISMEIEVAG